LAGTLAVIAALLVTLVFEALVYAPDAVMKTAVQQADNNARGLQKNSDQEEFNQQLLHPLPLASSDIWDTIHWRNILIIEGTTLRKPCVIRVTAGNENQQLRNTLADILTMNTGCQLLNRPEDTNPDLLTGEC
jgi:hypothetical protein